MYQAALVFALLLTVGLATKAHIGIGVVTTTQSGDEDIAALLSSNGFAVRKEEVNWDLAWIHTAFVA